MRASLRSGIRPAVLGETGPLGTFGSVLSDGRINRFVASQRGLCGWSGGAESGLVQEAQEDRHMTVIVPEVEFLGLLVWVGFCGRRFVLIIVMAEVLYGFGLLVPTIFSHRRPRYLER
ncbi:hypothetical protein NTGM5_130078 [Candidatus Nitrotoga sp. M5]|nr:hypothetical protein NTGM5_130078 [Candidatus Nitrotoga sp. M5]